MHQIEVHLCVEVKGASPRTPLPSVVVPMKAGKSPFLDPGFHARKI
jgi:hypothetical protein